MTTDYVFPAIYEFEHLNELDSVHTRRLFFPGGTSAGGSDGINVHVIPHNGVDWVGTFASGRLGSNASTGVWTTPNPTKLCIISQGQGYIVDALSPGACEPLPIFPIFAVRSSAKHRLLIFASYTELLAYGVMGVIWRTKRLSWDGLKLTSMTEDQLCGHFWDIRSESEQSFTVDLATGNDNGDIES